MSKRNKIVEETAESKTLKLLREKSDLSIRKIAERIGISKSRVSQIESGRDEVKEEYIEKFLEALELSWADWSYELGEGESKTDSLRSRCHDLLDEIPHSSIDSVYQLLSRFK